MGNLLASAGVDSTTLAVRHGTVVASASTVLDLCARELGLDALINTRVGCYTMSYQLGS